MAVSAPPAHAGMPADAATCAACVAEIFDPFSRRFRYPLTNCAHCGPRLSIITAMPHDRARTTLAGFALCADCQAEYDSPADRHFQAQAIACHACGPRLRLQRMDGRAFALDSHTFLDDCDAAGTLLAKGHVLAIQGLGGYQLACDATLPEAVARLRALKQIETKPLALMVAHLDAARAWCELSQAEAQALQGPAAPIVLLRRRADIAAPGPAAAVAPGLDSLGLMLPSTGVHHLVLRRMRRPIVLTSSGRRDEPQAITREALVERFPEGIDHVLDHPRAIARRLDESVLRLIDGQLRVLRRARGLAPVAIALPAGFEQAPLVLAQGGGSMHSLCRLHHGQAVLTPEMGEPEDAATLRGLHHHALIAACLADNGWPLHAGPVLGVALDDLGCGADGQLWGGEFARVDYRQFQRLGCFKPVAVLGGARAPREPWRDTYAHLMAELKWPAFTMNYAELPLHAFLAGQPRELLDAQLRDSHQSPLASSCGRLIEAAAAAMGLCRDHADFDGQGAWQMEACVDHAVLQHEDPALAYPFSIPRLAGSGLPYIEPLAMWAALLGDLILHTPVPTMAARFHKGLAASIVRMVHQLAQAQASPLRQVALSGGVFQNRVLHERVAQGLRAAGYQVLSHQRVPCNDSGLALGQACIAAALALHPLPQETASCA